MGSGTMVGPVAVVEKAPHNDNMVSDFMSLYTILPDVLDDFFLFSWMILDGLFSLSARWLSSKACMHSSSLALLFSMSLFTIGEVYVT